MQIHASEHAEINQALVELATFSRPSDKFAPNILEKINAILDECCHLPEWQAEKHYMDAGLAAVVTYLAQTYPWLTPNAAHAVYHECMMYMK